MTSRIILAGVFLLFLAACGQNNTSPPTSKEFHNLQQIGPSGGTVTLASGALLSVSPGVLPANQNVDVRHSTTETASAPNPAWQPAPGVVHVKFSSSIPTEASPAPGATPSPALTLTVPYSAANANAILAARAPVVVLTYADGNMAKISPNGTFDTSASTVQVTVPREVLNGATGVDVYLATDASVPTPSPGPRYWNGSAWQTAPIQLDPSKRTLVFVHGIFSSVESAFPCVNSILSAGGYQQAVGLDYDWTQPPYTEAPLLANLVNGLPNASVDVEAHSYGTVVTLATLPSISKSVKNVVLLGGPLPLNGSPQADPGLLRDTLVNLAEFVVPPSLVQRAVNSGMLNSLASDSSTMQSIAQGTLGMAVQPSYVEAAGTQPLPYEQYAGVHFLYELLYDFQSNDGVVEQISAESQDFGQPKIAGTFAKDHIQLECDPSIIQFVGSQIVP